MEACSITLDDVRRLALTVRELALALSYVQVEEGLLELEACWEGFCDSSNHFGTKFDDEWDCAWQFGVSLRELYESPECSFK